jgi:ParB family chromosome partitioning protein
VLHTPVKVKSSNGKNKIEIEFQDEEDLERLFEELIAAAS